MDGDELAALEGRPGWTVTGRVAEFAPVPGGWVARVQAYVEPVPRQRWHIVIVEPSGKPRYVMRASTLQEARRVAEGHVRAKHPE